MDVSRTQKWPGVDVLALDLEHALHGEGALDRRNHAGHEMDALEHHRPALLKRPLDDGADADEDVPRLVQEPGQRRVVRFRCRRPGLEARVVDRRHELLREERTHRLADEVGGRDARDSQAVRDLRRHAGLPGAGAAADEDDDRQVELLELAVAPQPPHGVDALVLAQHVLGKLLQALEVYGGLAALLEIRLDAKGELPRANRGQPRADERAGEEALRVREVTLAAQRQVVESPRLCHAGTRSATAASASATSSESRSGSPGSGTTSFRANTTRAPRSRAASATTSIAAALISIT